MQVFNPEQVWRVVRSVAGWSTVAVALVGCLGGRYQAPISEQGEVMDQSGPLIVSNSDDSPSRYGGGSVSRPATVSAASANVASSQDRPGVHRVANGESLYSIAFQYDLDFRSLAIANNLRPPYTIFTGQELSLDVNRPADQSTGATAVVGVGRVVENNSIARAQAATPTVRGVMRQPITRTTVEEPDWQWPLRGQILTNFQADTSARKGIDIGAVRGQPVHAAAAGEVVYAGSGIQGSGNLIIVRHSERLLSAYAHNSTLLVSEGQRIRAGEQIAEAGANAEGVALLHFEIRQDGKPVDPLGYLPRL